MINLIRALGLDASASTTELEYSLLICRASGASEVDGIAVDRLESVLGDPERYSQYYRVHRQYSAIADALDLLDLPGAVDSHRWRDRSVEFHAD